MSSNQMNKILNKKHIDSILEARKTSFTPTYWHKHIADNNHYRLVMDTKSPPDYRLLYDAWLWRHVVKAVAQWKKDALILELLPGMSLIIPVALQSAQFEGTLFRLNDEPPVPLPKTLHFAERWIPGQLADLVASSLIYDLIVGNHIIDDLLFDLYCPDLEARKRFYFDPELCKEVWELMVKSGDLPLYQSQLATVFLNSRWREIRNC